MPDEVRRVRIGVIGTGWWATEAHLPAIKGNPDADITAICDTRPERLKLAAETFDVSKVYTDYREMLVKETLEEVAQQISSASGSILLTDNRIYYLSNVTLFFDRRSRSW